MKNNIAPELAGPLNEISLASEHAASLTRQLLTFSRKQTIQPRTLDLNDVIKNITKMLTRLLGAEIALKLEPTSKLPAIHADAGMVEQVIINLAVNARDAMPKGGEIHIRTAPVEINQSYVKQRHEARVGNFVCLSVVDAGTGMDAATMTRIFEPFFTTKEPGKGTGLGLATVYGIVQSHQGWIEVSSIPGKGTTFKIFLPVAEISTLEQAEPLLPEQECRGDETILIVEDVPALREMVRQILESYGYTVIEAPDGVSALSVWKEHKQSIDLLLTDIVMPEGVSGHDLAKKFIAEKKSLEVIYTSGHSIDLIGRDAKLREGFNFLQKPYQALTLAQTIRNCLDRNGVSIQ